VTENNKGTVSGSDTADQSSSKDSEQVTKNNIGTNIETAIDNLIHDVETINSSIFLMVIALQKVRQTSEAKTKETLKLLERLTQSDSKSGRSVEDILLHEISRILETDRRYANGVRLIARSGITTLVSQYDAFVARLIRIVLTAHPEILDTSDRQITFAQLSGYASIEMAREAIIEKEIEAVLRTSHSEHFEWFEKKLDVKLRSGLEIWPDLIELTERRNLFTHTNGVVSAQYIQVCARNGVDLPPECVVSSKLEVKHKYFKHACNIIIEIGAKLGHVLWRKLAKKDSERANNSLSHLTYKLLTYGRYEACQALTIFAKNSPIWKHMKDRDQLICLVNLGQTYRDLKQTDKLSNLLMSIDWSAKSNEFQLAKAVLASDWAAASDWMRRIGSSSSPNKEDCRMWPLFRHFRKEEEFRIAFSDIFSQDFEAYSASVLKTEIESEPVLDGVSTSAGEVPGGNGAIIPPLEDSPALPNVVDGEADI
jgi:hypothetical protein